MAKLKWYVKQMAPLKYKTTCGIKNFDDLEDGRYYVEWRMWFGQCFCEKWNKI